MESFADGVCSHLFFSNFSPNSSSYSLDPPNLIPPSSKNIDLICSMFNKKGSFMYSVLGQGKHHCRSLE